ncbi:VIR protein [Plasmodium vivax]|uniref:VIR protein n=1 Tax=Plasmodium vivax TaxID=5855 RepID=A0A1G4EDS6_PLAVI|nr:VIR protein [Plasmodium vivax]
MTFSESSSAEDICKEFKLLYISFLNYSAIKKDPKKIFSFGDCDFLNYWLNDKLRKSVKDGDNIDVRGFYEEIKNKDPDFFYDNEDLEDYMKIIDPEILKNMELLYDLYYYERTILNMLLSSDQSEEYKNPCSYYTDNCYKSYTAALNRCLDGYKEFCMALKYFNISYNYSITRGTQDLYNCKTATNFRLPEHDPVLEREKKEIMLIQGSTSFLMFILTFPLIYKFTPVGPFLQEKIKKVKNMWKSPKKNKEKMLSSSMDIGNNISDNRKYKLAYNSVTNE